ncbi:MAG: transglycosylase SLT domain-containing protein [Acidobacteriota bacterium]
MLGMLRSSRIWRLFYALLLPIVCVTLFSSFAFKFNPVLMTSAQRERAITQLNNTIERAGGKPTDDQLQYFERTYPGTHVAALARFLRAYLRFTTGDFTASAPLFEEALIKQDTELGDYALYYQGRAYRELADHTHARAAFVQLAEKYPQSIFAREAQLAAADLCIKLGEPKQAIKQLKKLVEVKDSAALLLTAQCYQQLGENSDALAAYRKLYYEAPHSSESELALTQLTLLGFKAEGKDGYQLERTRADYLFEAGQYSRAAENYKKLSTQFPAFATHPRNWLRLGVSLYKLGNFRDALSALLTVPATEKELQLEASYYAANCYRRLRFNTQFVDTANQVLAKQLPSNWGAELLAALIEQFGTNSVGGQRYRNQLIKQYPQSKEADEVSYRAAWQLHTEKRYEEASEALLEHLVNFPNSDWRGLAAFWAARDAERANRLARALAIYQVIPQRYRYGYYGYLSEQRLNNFRTHHTSIKPEQPEANSRLARALYAIKPAAPLAETITDKATPHLARAASLVLLNLNELALIELETARRDAPTSPRINFEIARIYRARGENLRAVQALQRAHPDYHSYQGDEAPREVFEIFFPLTEWETIKAEATRYGLDPYIVAGLIRQESVFDPRARSRANALGLMQLLPSTGKLVARKQQRGTISADQLYNPELNIKLGVAYLADMINRFGRIEYAAAAYNGGPGRVDRWLRTLPSELDEWVEAIPISETRLYVQGVLRNAAHYRRLYGKVEKTATRAD